MKKRTMLTLALLASLTTLGVTHAEFRGEKKGHRGEKITKMADELGLNAEKKEKFVALFESDKPERNPDFRDSKKEFHDKFVAGTLTEADITAMNKLHMEKMQAHQERKTKIMLELQKLLSSAEREKYLEIKMQKMHKRQ